MTHNIKLQCGFADSVNSGEKNFEIRKNDRGYQKGDKVQFSVIDNVGLRMYHPLEEKTFIITYVMSGYGLENGYVVFGIKAE